MSQLTGYLRALVFFDNKCHNLLKLSVCCSHLSWSVLAPVEGKDLVHHFITTRYTALGIEYEPYHYLLNERESQESNEWNNPEGRESFMHRAGTAIGTLNTCEWPLPASSGFHGQRQSQQQALFLLFLFPGTFSPWIPFFITGM